MSVDPLALVGADGPVALVVAEGVGAAFLPIPAGPAGPPRPGTAPGDAVLVGWPDAIPAIAAIERERSPRWVWWNGETPRVLVAHDVRPARCWDVAAVQRLLVGGWRADPATVWADLHGLDPDTLPAERPADLFHQPDEDPAPLTADGYLDPAWVGGGWRSSPARLGTWVALLGRALLGQQARIVELGVALLPSTARSESTTELLCAEIEADGLPLDRDAAELVIAGIVGPRPADAQDAAGQQRSRDALVLRHVPDGAWFDLRNPLQVKSMLRRAGIEVPDTRAWRLEPLRSTHPIVEDLLRWRKAERIHTTFGYAWLDEHVDPDGRLRGRWSASDGAAGRMTATAGLHNMPAELRSAIAAEPEHLLVRADLGQIEPRVLAAVSGDRALQNATRDDDMYLPVADRLRVDRDVAKVAVLGAMYGQTSGRGAEALAGLERAYPVAMAYLRDAASLAAGGNDLRTVGGRLVRMANVLDDGPSERDRRARAAARGRYGRNAMIQGAAAELFKLWAVITRARGRDLRARIVLCLHDELLVHVPADRAESTRAMVLDALAEAAHRWAPQGSAVRFVADVSIVERWSQVR